MIEVYNSCIKITDYKQNEEIEKYLSVWDKASFKRTWEAFHYDEENNVLTIPKINPYFVQHKLGKDVGIENLETQGGGAKAIYKLLVKPRSNVQADAIEFLLNETNPRKMLCLKPGEGKTYCTINFLSHIKKRSLVIVDRDRIMSQWKESFLKFTDLHESEIMILSGSDTIRDLMKEKTPLKYKVYIASHRTLASYMSENPSLFTEFVDKYEIGVKVIDEAHVEVKNIVLLDGFANIGETIYLTATPKRSNFLEDKVYQVIFKDVAKFDDVKSRNKKYHNVALVSFNSKPTTKEEALCSSKRGFDLNAYGKYLFETRFDCITNIIDNILKLTMKKSGKIAIVIHNLNHIEMVKEHLLKYVNEDDIGLFCGLITTKKEREKQLDKKIILTTEKQVGKAVDIDDLRFLLMTVPTSSEVITEQMIGRLRPLKDNREVIFFDITDEGFSACKSQRTKRKRIFKNFAVRFIRINL